MPSPDLTVSFVDRDAPAALARVLRVTGFAVLVDHPIDSHLVAETYAEWARFFDRPDKAEHHYDTEHFSGFYPFRSENAKDRSTKDLKEFFHVFGSTALPAGMSRRTYDLFRELEALASTLLGWVEDETPNDIRRGFSMPLRDMVTGSGTTLLRILHYPPLPADVDRNEVRASAHEDINLLTLLPAGTAPGLELLDRSGDWLAIDADPTAIIVNSGDMLQMASGGYYPSATHRVVNPPEHDRDRSRYSMPLFLHPRPDVRLSPTHTAGEYLAERLAEIGLVRPSAQEADHDDV